MLCRAVPCRTALVATQRCGKHLSAALPSSASVDATIMQQRASCVFRLSDWEFIGETGIPKKSVRVSQFSNWVLGVSYKLQERNSRGRITRRDWTRSDSECVWRFSSRYEREIIAAEAREWNEVEPRVQKNTGGRPVKIWSVIGRFSG
jgi:hypothetical protein